MQTHASNRESGSKNYLIPSNYGKIQVVSDIKPDYMTLHIEPIDNENPDLILESSIDYVNGQTAQTIVNYQADATFQALIEQSVPCAKISIDNPNEINIGQLIAFIQSTVYYLCLLLNVNWANNPMVVIGKKICNEALRNKIPPEVRKKTREKMAEDKY